MDEPESLHPLGHWNDVEEEDKNFLQSSLFALTTHLAQVQFRLRQVVNAPLEEDRDELLKSLEEFSFKSVNLDFVLSCDSSSNLREESNLAFKMIVKRNQQKELLAKLKTQLNELKMFSCGVSKQLFYRLKLKENVEEQLRTQIVDLEHFIDYLKSRSATPDARSGKTLKGFLVEFIEKSGEFLQMLTVLLSNTYFNYTTTSYNKKRSNHWGDLRAQLELDIIKVRKLVRSKYRKGVTLAVRKHLASSIKNLMQHGTKSSGNNEVTLIPFSCFDPQTTHGWDIIVQYYHLKNGRAFNSSAYQKLCTSFNLEVAGQSPKRNQRNLLCAIEMILTSHSKYKRSSDSKFKAFVCAGLNANRLVNWLNSIFHCGKIVDRCYYPWSYVARTRYRDGLKSLDVLTGYKFELPVDFDVRKFQIDEVFS